MKQLQCLIHKGEEVLETVRELEKEQDITVLSITHDVEEAALADRIIIMNKGKIFEKVLHKKYFI